MGKHCFMEDAYHFLRLKWNRIGRRNTFTAVEVPVGDEMVTTHYHAPTEFEEMLKKNYQLRVKKPLAFFIPPSFLEPYFRRNPFMLRFLNFLEGIFGNWTALASWADHYIIIAERK